MVPFKQHSKIINNYCIVYSGYCDEYLVLLKFLKPIIEQQYFPIKITIACKDDKIHLAGENSIGLSQLDKAFYGCVYYLLYNGIQHPIELLIEDSDIQHRPVDTLEKTTNKAVVITQGNHPTKSLTPVQIQKLKGILMNQGFFVEIDGDIESAGCVAGVESSALFQAAINGIRTILIPTGIGTRLYRKLFLKGEVLSI